jgi:hypothetical protein
MDTGIERRYRPLPLRDVRFAGGFWEPRLRTNRERSIPHIHRQNHDTGRLAAFHPDWSPSPATVARHAWGGTPVMFWDSDVAKWMEAAAYSIATHPDPHLEAQLDTLIGDLERRQLPDGYLNSWFITVDPQNRWKNLRDWHELYCAGHLIEAAVAHYEATGKRTFLDIMCRYADYIDSVFGAAEGKLRGYCGHPEIELALVRLARATGERRYLELSRYFVEERGRRPHYFDIEARERGESPDRFWARSYEYNQAHRPVREQREVVGHAVRAVYLYSAMVDLAGEYGDPTLLATCETLWRHLTTKRTYVMGGIGTSRQNEGFTSDYDLPNESAYAETCAAIGLIFWAQRMLQYGCDRRYADMLELALYNAVLSGGALDGESFFYDNPLASNGGHHRRAWFECPCCPPNLARIFASLAYYAYAQGDDEAVVHLYTSGNADFAFGDRRVTIEQETRYPWDGAIALTVRAVAPTTFALRVRAPAWCPAARVHLNGAPLDAIADAGGYLRIEREWSDGDVLRLDLELPIVRRYAHPEVLADRGQVALQRGPIVYCFEQVDHTAPLRRALLPRASALTARYDPELLGGVAVIEGAGIVLSDDGWEEQLYRDAPPATEPIALRAIPYYAWDHRSHGVMRVWMPEG